MSDRELLERDLHFTPEEHRRGWSMQGGTKIYCCYGMYCDAGHDSSCQYRTNAGAAEVPAPSPASAGSGQDAHKDARDAVIRWRQQRYTGGAGHAPAAALERINRDALQVNIEAFLRDLPDLLVECPGAWVIYRKGKRVEGRWPTFEAVLEHGYGTFGLAPFIVQQVKPIPEPIVRYTATTR